jgi:hypothetical protein
MESTHVTKENSATSCETKGGDNLSVEKITGVDGQTAARQSTRMIKTIDSIFDQSNHDISMDSCESNVEDLVSVGLLVKEIHDEEDRVYYRAKDGIDWSDLAHIDCPIKKEIMLSLIENPQTFFVLYNTQKGKMKIAAQEIRSWASVPGKKVVAFLVVDNDKTLADQSADGLLSIIIGVAKVFLLSSNNANVTLEAIRTYIDAYAADKDGEYMMPVIVSLNNNTQRKKVCELMQHIKNRVKVRSSLLRYGVVFDEADKVYPSNRVQFMNFIVDETYALHRLGFVTATEGDLMDRGYPECANAYMFPVPDEDPNYRAIHGIDANVITTGHRVKDSNDVYAETVMAKNAAHFASLVVLKDGTQGYRKTIINGDVRNASMEKSAVKLVTQDKYAITLSQHGIWVYRPGHPKKHYATAKNRINELLYKIYKELKLDDKPLFLIGRRKVDRGLGFHYAPRQGDLTGLIWTDMILGRVDDKETAVQKAGRLCGIVAQCPQYPVNGLTWWTDTKTRDMICKHNNTVDASNKLHGCTALQSLTRGLAAVIEDGLLPVTHESISRVEEFPSISKLKQRWDSILLTANKPKQRASKKNDGLTEDENGCFMCSIGDVTMKQTADAIRRKFPNGCGVASWGSGITNANEGDYVKRMYVGYDENNKPIFFLRWTIKD